MLTLLKNYVLRCSKRTLALCCFACLLLMAKPATAQLKVLYVAPGDTMFVSVGDTLHIWGLGLTPSTRLKMDGISTYRYDSVSNPLAVAIKRAFVFTPGAPDFKGLYKFWYTADELNNIKEEDLILFFHANSWDTVANVVHDMVEKVITSTNVTILPNELTLSVVSSLLPMNWLQTSATLKSKDVSVQWQTGAESNVEGYSVLHSTNGTSWAEIGKVGAKGSIKNSYSFLHTNAPTGINYYRIKANELSGAPSLSKVMIVHVDGENQLRIYPNPSNAKQPVMLYVDKPGLIHVYRSNGTLVSSTYYSAGTHVIDSKGINPGTYIVSDGKKVLAWIHQL